MLCVGKMVRGLLKVDFEGSVGLGVALCGGFLVVFDGAGDIFFNAIAIFIQEAELILCFGVAAFGGAH